MVSRLPDDDEQLHAPAGDAGWSEAYGFDFAFPDLTLAGFVVMTVHPQLGRSWCWAAVGGQGRDVCVVDEPEAPLPRRRSMELRAPALWVDVEIEVPFVHATVGMEAFGLCYDDPDEALRSGRGERVPFGLDLEWESDGGLEGFDEGSSVVGASGYELTCRVTGEVLLGPERHEIDCRGRRWHRWGGQPWWTSSPSPASAITADAPDERPTARAVARVPFAEDTVEARATLASAGWSFAGRAAPGPGGMAP